MSDPTATVGHMNEPTVAVVLTGAAARGAFQAGALAQVLPSLQRQGLTPTIYLGTSAGAINSALYGSFAHLPMAEATQKLLDVWRSMDSEDVYRRPLFSALRDWIRWLPGALFGRGPGVASLLDTAPLRRTAHEVLDAEQIAANVQAGVLAAVGVAATRVPPAATKQSVRSDPTSSWQISHAQSVLFLDTLLDYSHVADPERALQVAAGPVVADQVLASSAIPVAFPPVEVSSPGGFEGWYLDGGIRLNAPLRPAVALGADHLIVIAAHPTRYPTMVPMERGPEPNVLDAAALSLQVILADRVIEDLQGIRTRNRWLAEGADLRTGDGRPLHMVKILEISPPPGVLAELAADVLADQKWDLDAIALRRFLDGVGYGPGAKELLSYGYFNSDYFSRQIEVGAQAADKALRDGWQ